MKNNRQRQIIRFGFTPWAALIGGIMVVVSMFMHIGAAIVHNAGKEYVEPEYVVSGTFDPKTCKAVTDEEQIVVKCEVK